MNKIKSSFSVLIVFVLCLFAIPLFSGCSDIYDPTEPTISYKDFGAVGDGKTDDFDAIYATHEYANANGIAVSADPKATYYIGAHNKSVVIKTNTYWRRAKFIIDDVGIEDSKVKNADIFSIQSYTKSQKITIPAGYKLKAEQKNINLKFSSPKLLHIVNDNKKDFIRSGADQNDGSSRQEVILVDENGNVDPTTPILWDYTELTKITAYNYNETPLLVCGGEFTTIASNIYNGYFNRGISTMRSNTTVRGVKHNVINEIETGSPYRGFIGAEYASDVTFEDCLLYGHLTIVKPSGITCGTYDIYGKLANNITWKNCNQINSIKKGWGIMGSNHCKNLNMIGCTLSRFDAHQGVYNATIKNTTLGQDLSVVGFGKLYLENVHRDCVKSADYGEASFLNLRSDYGAFWKGKVIMRNCTMNSNATVNYLIKEVWRDWNYGYTCYLPEVLVDNVKINYVGKNKKPSYWVFSKVDWEQTPQTMAASNNPLVMPKKVTVKNETTVFKISTNEKGLFDKTIFEKRKYNFN